MLKKCLLALWVTLLTSASGWASGFTYENDPAALWKLRSLAHQLVSASHLRLDYHLGIVADNEINAFATRSSRILLTRRLLQLVHTDEELAAILAHELGHLSQKVSSPAPRSFSSPGGDEREADLFAIQVLHRAGFDARALYDVLARVTQAWGDELPAQERRKLEKRLRTVAKKTHLEKPIFSASLPTPNLK